MVELRYKVTGDPAKQFQLRLQRRAPEVLDNIHKQVAIRLTTVAKANLENSRVREWESGQRTRHRLTGTLTGKYGHSAAITGHVLNRGTTPGGANRQGKGVGWPDVQQLNRRARHWRVLEYGTPYVTMPIGVWVAGNASAMPTQRTSGHIFMPYKEFLGKAGLSKRSLRTIRGENRSRARRSRSAAVGNTRFRRGDTNLYTKRRGEGWAGKFFLQKAWEEVAGSGGSRIFAKYEKAFEQIFGDFR